MFKFTGAKIRIVDSVNNNHADEYIISVDGATETYTHNYSQLTKSVVVYEKTDLEDTTHTVVLKCSPNSSVKRLYLDAIDIGENSI